VKYYANEKSSVTINVSSIRLFGLGTAALLIDRRKLAFAVEQQQ
jgi:hypothetical protein